MDSAGADRASTVGTRPRIALIEDEASVRRALARVLSVAQFEVQCYESAQEFLDSVSASLPDCVVLDIQMPGLTGRDVQRHLLEAEIRLPVIIVTAHDEPQTRAQCIAAGAVAYLCKPLRSENLIASINSALGRER
jgi:FixJ family two-component response regulator